MTDPIDDVYYKTLCSQGLAFVAKQQSQLEHRRTNLVDQKQKLVYNNYDSFLKFSHFSKKLINDFQVIEETLAGLKETIPHFKSECERFSRDAQQISQRWQNVSLMLAKYPQLIEFLEIPQLLNNCIRTYFYDDAIKICNFVTKLCTKHADDAAIFCNMLAEVDKCKDVMVAQITKELSGNIQLPACMKMVQYLQQTGRFTDAELRTHFLICRDVWLQSELNKDRTNNQAYTLSQLSRMTESFRINIFDIVTQYQAIFPEFENHTIRPTKQQPCPLRIINSWLVLKIDQYLNLLRTTLGACVTLTSTINLDSLIDNCFYFGLSMNKIGADIRPQLVLIFNDFIEKRFGHGVEKANRRFSASLPDIFQTKKTAKTPDSVIETYPILLNYQADLYGIFNEIRNKVPLCLVPMFTRTLNSSFMFIVTELKSYVKKQEFGLNSAEFQNYLDFCDSIRNVLPSLNESYQRLCPVQIVGQRLGLTALEINRMPNISSAFELDIKTPNEQINSLIRDISVRLKSDH